MNNELKTILCFRTTTKSYLASFRIRCLPAMKRFVLQKWEKSYPRIYDLKKKMEKIVCCSHFLNYSESWFKRNVGKVVYQFVENWIGCISASIQFLRLFYGVDVFRLVQERLIVGRHDTVEIWRKNTSGLWTCFCQYWAQRNVASFGESASTIPNSVNNFSCAFFISQHFKSLKNANFDQVNS